ncbi:hypothetical protein R5R35_001739 [Gryllus longicercus]|uniref:Angiotensin-converting enzyme n=1 Tax=Gryllus longicercus TaxID=2509291 RepID=A0AAN9W6C7_9ORTH
MEAAAVEAANASRRGAPGGPRAARWWCLAAIAVLLVAARGGPQPAAAQAPDQITEDWIKKYLREEYEPEVTRQCNRLNNAEWTYETNINEDTEAALQNATLEYAAFEKEQWQNYFSRVNYTEFEDEVLIRQLDSLSVLGIPALGLTDLEELSTSTTNMTSTYSTAKICPYKKQACALNEMLSLDPGIEEIISKSRDYDELTYVWKAWRDASGKLMRENYKKYVQLNNKAAEMNGFEDMGEMWRHDYDSESLKEEMLGLWETIEPLYVELHKYVRTKLKQHYGEQLVASDGLLPAHVLGNMWAQSWGNIFDLVKPFPEGSAVNVTQSLIDQGYDALRMFKTSDDFYISLGLANNSVSYGKDAMLVRPTDREVVCHASAWDFCNGKDYRIKMCTKINMEDFVTIHHEMGHIQYFIQYKDQPYVFRKGANPGFHEAIGDTIALSVSTPKHLKEVGLLGKDYPDTEEDNINALMAMALDKVAFLPFGLLIDMWRWDVFSGNVTSDQWNEHWWYLRKTIQRIKPPVPRNEEDFDPGAKFHVPGDSQYIAYFIAHVLQFQFHKSLCEAAGQYNPNDTNSEPLHKCDIFRSIEAGNLLRKGLQLGGSTHWRDALEAITGQREYSGEPLLEYFKPLYDFLVSENTKSEGKGEVIEDKPIEEKPKGDVEESVVPAKKNEVPSNGLSSQESAVKDVKGPEETKSQEPTDQTVPIVVGCVLGALLVCILIGYVIFRRRAAKRSADIPSTTGSKALP